jgi:hypothetical protein
MPFDRIAPLARAALALAALLPSAVSAQATPTLRDWDLLPVLDTRQYKQFSSYDRSEAGYCLAIDAGNKDFNNFLGTRGATNRTYCERTDGAAVEASLGTGHLIAASDSGPGVVSRIFLTAASFANTVEPGFLNETIRIYTDDLVTPVFQGKVLDLTGRAGAPFDWPMTGDFVGAIVSSVPFPYKSKLRVMLGGLQGVTALYYYHVDTVEGLTGGAPLPPHFDVATPSAFKSLDTGIALDNQAINDAQRAPWVDQNATLAPGQTLRLLDKTGPATLRYFRFFLPTADVAHLADLNLRVTWDNEATPAISASLATLFGQGSVLGSMSTTPMRISARDGGVTLELGLPMPFKSRAVVELSAKILSTQVVASIAGTGGVPALPFGKLRVQTNFVTAQTRVEQKHTLLNVQGRGKYVGTLIDMHGTKTSSLFGRGPYNFLEGDELVTVDGLLRSHGTGTEDYFNAGWYFANGAFSSAFAGASSRSADATNTFGQASAVRWHTPLDAISYQRSLKFELEYGANIPSTMTDYRSVAFYYAP